MNIVFVAGGRSTRFNHLSKMFPKILLPTSKSDSILANNIQLLDNPNNNLFLIINHNFYDMVVEYLDRVFIDYRLKIFKAYNTNGSYNSIRAVAEEYKEEFPLEDVLFIWSDLILDKSFNPNKFDSDSIGTFRNLHNRYDFSDGNVFKSTKGNIIGIYYIKDLTRLFELVPLDKYTDNFDLVDAIAKDIETYGSEYKAIPIENIEEYRDYEIYKKLYKSKSIENKAKTRFFNEMRVVEKDGHKCLFKKVIDPNYRNVMKNEYQWYESLTNSEFSKFIPKIYGVDRENDNINGFYMEYLEPNEYCTLYEYIYSFPQEESIEVYENIRKSLDMLHESSIKLVSKEIFERDLRKEIVSKVLKRCDGIHTYLQNYNREKLSELLERTYNVILEYEPNDTVEYCICHGDLNASNVMVNKKTREIKYIDPRGYFGDTFLYGWPAYDFAKILYGLNGYDNFNLSAMIYLEDEPSRHSLYGKIEYLNNPLYKILVGVIYIALAGYICQDVMKANIAYDYGVKILKDALEEHEKVSKQ